MISLAELLRFEVNETNLPVRREQVRARVAMYPAMILPAMAMAYLLVWVMWGVVAHDVLLGWLVVTNITQVFEMSQWWRYRKLTQDAGQCRRWDARFKRNTTIGALAWGSAWVLMFVSGDLGYQALLICVVMGFTSAAISINTLHRPSLLIYLVLVLAPLIARVAWENDQQHWFLAFMLLIYGSFLLSSAFKLMRTFELSLQQRFDKEALLYTLRVREEETARALEAAELANVTKSRFLATASHDLRQPLQALRLFTEALQDTAKDEQTAHLAKQIGKSVNALVDMFDDLLDVSRLDAGIIQPRLQHFALYDLFDRLYVDFAQLAQAKGLLLELPYNNEHEQCGTNCAAVVYSDPFLLERMLRNLISNAIRYTDHGRVRVQCNCTISHVEIAVKDTGIGIRPEVIKQIFEEYYQVDNPHRDRRKGLGLGLAIVRRVEELLGYHVKVESEPGQGSSFSFSVKKGDPDVLARPFVITQTRYDVDGKVIALVEDDQDIREFTAELMQGWGCRVFAEATGAEMLRTLDIAAVRPDLLVCDYRLPNNQTALSVMKQMREFWGDLPILVVTGDTGAETLQAIQKSGASLLHKPIAPMRLRSAMFLVMQGTAATEP